MNDRDERPWFEIRCSLFSIEHLSGSEHNSSVKSAKNAILVDHETRSEASSDEQSEEVAAEHNQFDDGTLSAHEETDSHIWTDAQSGQEAVEYAMSDESVLSKDDHSLDSSHDSRPYVMYK